MLVFFIKKAFFDGWDQLFGLVLLNAVFVALGLGALFLAPLLAGLPALLAYGALALLFLAASLHFSACVYALRGVAEGSSLSFRAYREAFRPALLPGLQAGALLLLALLAFGVGLPFYLARGFLGAIAAGLLLWTLLTLILALQWFLPLGARLGGGFRKNFRKSLVLLFDNPGFTLFLLAYNLLGLGLSFVLVMLAPGPAGTALALDEALRLRLRKYDWLEGLGEEAGGKARRQVPWAELLAEDRELLGTRSLRSLIFPWKD